MPNCAIKLCRNFIGNKSKKKNISFHRFPTDPVLASRWTNVIRKSRGEDYWKPSKTSCVCSDHFNKEDIYVTNKRGLKKIKKGAVPCMGLFLSSVEESDSYLNKHNFNQPSSSKSTSAKPAEINSAEAHTDETVEDSSDIDSVFDTPHKARLRKELRRRIVIQNKHARLIKLLKQRNLRLKKKAASYKQVFESLEKERYIDHDTHNIFKDNLFAAQLYDSMVKKKKENRRPITKYSPEFRKFCLTLNFLSPRAYNYVRQKFDTCIPHQKTIAKWYMKVDGSPGLTKDAFKILKLKRQNSEKNIVCALVADEMSIRKQKCWNEQIKQDEGLVDLGTGPNDQVNKRANEAYVLLLVSLEEPWKLPVGYFLVQGLTGTQKANIIKTVLTETHSAGVDVVSLTFDGHKSNLSAMEILGCQINPKLEMKTTFQHPVAEHKVAVFLDICHMVKLVRNHMELKETFLYKNKEIKWKYLQTLCDLQKETGLNLANKLTKRHIHFRNSVMNVKLATQLLSRSVSNALEFCRTELQLQSFEGSEETEKFILLINDVFDILNSRNLTHHGLKHPLFAGNKEIAFETLERAKKYIFDLNLKTSRKRTYQDCSEKKKIIVRRYVPALETRADTGFLGIIVCIESLKKIYEILISTERLKYLCTYRISQDHIETFFGAIRSHGGYNDNPNARQFKGIYRKMLCHMELKAADSGNCVPLEQISILTCSSAMQAINNTTLFMRRDDDDENQQGDVDQMMEIEGIVSMCDILNDMQFKSYTAQIVGYISGFVVKSLSKYLKCQSCLETLKSDEKYSFHKLVGQRDKGGLIYATEDVFKICELTECNLRIILKTHQNVTPILYHKIVQSVMKNFIGSNTLLGNNSTHENGDLHRNQLLKLIIEKYLAIRLYHIAKLENISHDVNSKRKIFRKIIQREGF